MPDPAEGGANPGVAGEADQPYRDVTECDSSAGRGAGSDLGRITMERDIADPADSVFYGPASLDVAGEFGGGDLVERQAGDHEGGDGGRGLLRDPAAALASGHGAGDAAADPGDGAGMGMAGADRVAGRDVMDRV